MEFNSVEFLNIFLPLCLILCGIFPKKSGDILIIFSSIFYAWNSTIGFLLLILSVILVHHFKANQNHLKYSKIPLLIFLILPFIFFRSSTTLVNLIPILSEINKSYPDSLILPAGVSFYTFQLIGYLFDKNKFSERLTFKESFLFTIFFPQLIAGPIERAKDLMPQIKNIFLKGVYFDSNAIKKGLYLVSLGLFIKTFFGDYIASELQGDFYKSGSFAAITHIFSNGSVIYFDFLGYTFIAIGLAKFFNVNLTLNFKRPYASICVGEFWRRWHITLTNWFKDFIYKPLASKYKYSRLSILFSTLLVFTLTAQWHGFGFRFLVWGLSHFILVLISRRISPFCSNQFSKYLLWILSFTCINFLWLFFFYDFTKSFDIINQIFNFKLLNLEVFPKKIILLTPIAFFASLLIDPELIVNYPNTKIKDENELVILKKLSQKITSIFLKYTYNYYISTFLLLSSIAFFSYSRTFIYFRF